MNKSGLVRGTIKYGYAYGPRALVGPLPLGASEAFVNTGAKFVKRDGSGYFDAADGGDESILGWAECGEFTSGSSDGDDSVMVDISSESVYCIPADAAVSVAADLIGKTGSLVRDTNRQRFDVGTNAADCLLVVDIDIANQAVYVKINPVVQNEVGI